MFLIYYTVEIIVLALLESFVNKGYHIASFTFLID